MSARILIVDDTPLNVKLLAAKLAHDYYVVSLAHNGAEALTLLENEKPDIILLDAMMPEIDGFETCRRIKSNPRTAHIPVVMITALSDVSDRVKGLEAGADDFLTKPINDIALMARVRSLLRLKSIMDEWRSRDTSSHQSSPSAEQEDEFGLTESQGGHILVLEDDPRERALIEKTLTTLSAKVTFASTIAEAATLAQKGDIDLVFSSTELQNEDGLLICPQLRTNENTRHLPILLLAHDNEMPRIAKGLDLGANDYLIRPLDANEMLARTRTQLRQKRHYQRLRNNYEQTLSLALTDPLTGAFNRRYLDTQFPRLVTRHASLGESIAILIMDIDHFKDVNDTYGHAAGDLVLKELIGRTIQALRPTDLVVRMGGEEFAIIMLETNLSIGKAIGERLRERITAQPFTFKDGQSISMTVSMGVASLTPHIQEKDPAKLSVFERADAALYQAKQNGRNCVVAEG